MILQPVGRGGGGGANLVKFRWNKDLVGTKNGANATFVVPDPYFVQSSDIVIRVYRNGVRLREGATNDYTVSESGGFGTGFDTIDFNGLAPLPTEELTADYLVP